MTKDLQKLANRIIKNKDKKDVQWALDTVCDGDFELFKEVSRIVIYKLTRTTPLFTSWSENG
jgi:hypothetical protein